MDPTTLFGGQPFGLSPSSNEDMDDFGTMSDGESVEQFDSAVGPKRKGRRSSSTAEKRANHNAIERARRESLNGRFLELAHALPTMGPVKRPSKNSIVLKSLEFVKSARAREQALETENARLRNELNELRGKLGMQSLETSVPTTVVSQAPAITAVKTEAPRARSPTVVTAKPLSPAATAQSTAAAVGQFHHANHLATSNASFMPQDTLAASTGFYSVLDTFTPAAKGEGASPRSSTSDSDFSIVTTPPSFHSFDSSPTFFFEESAPAPSTTTFDGDFLAQCGLQSGFSTMPTWHTAGSIFGVQSASSGFPLFA